MRHLAAPALAAALLFFAAPAVAQEPPPWLKVTDGTTQPQFDVSQAIEETVFVETPLDTDDDGVADVTEPITSDLDRLERAARSCPASAIDCKAARLRSSAASCPTTKKVIFSPRRSSRHLRCINFATRITFRNSEWW